MNVLLEDGRLNPRYGYRTPTSGAAVTDWESSHGLEFVQGYTSGATPAYVNEFVSFDRKSTYSAGKCRPFARHSTTGLATELTTSAPAAVNLTTTGDWHGFSFNGYGYFCNPNETVSVQRYQVGDPDTWQSMGVPATPTAALTYKITYGGANGAYTQVSYAGLTPTSATHVACTGAADTSGAGANSLATLDSTTGQLDIYIKKPTSSAEFTVTIDLNATSAGIQDWTYNDIFAFSVATERPGFAVSVTGVEFINNDGSPITLRPDVFVNKSTTPSPTSGGTIIDGRAEFKNKTKADWDNVRKIKFTLVAIGTVSATNSLNRVTIWKPVVGGVNILGGSKYRSNNPVPKFGYAYHWSAASLESGIGGMLQLSNQVFRGYDPFGRGMEGLGVHIQFTATVSADSTVDNYRFYMMDDQGKWRRLTTQTDATHTFTHKIPYPEVIILSQYLATEFLFSNAKTGFPFKGWVVWLYKGGYQNVRHSRIGVPESVYSDALFDPEDENAGATFSLADNNADEPLYGCQADDAALIVGNDGVYASIGNRPLEMTPPKKLPGSFGAANMYCATRWTINGKPGVAVLSRGGEGIYFYSVNSGFDGQTGYNVTELSQPVRKSIKDFLMDPQSITTLATARLFVEEQTDALWLILGKRAMVLRRPSLTDGNRNWEFYSYTMTGTIGYVAVSPQYRMRWTRSTGIFDEVEYNNETPGYISTSTRDSGAAMPTPYWTSKMFTGPRRRSMWGNIHKQNTTDTPTLTNIATQATSAQTCTSGNRVVKFGVGQMGWEHQYKISLVEGQGYVADVEITESGPGPGDKRRV